MAAEQSVVTSFRALDRVSGVMSKMSGAVKKFGKVSEDSFSRASRSSSRFGDIVKGVISANIIIAGISTIARGLYNFAKSSVDLASDLTEVQNVVDTTFGQDGAKQINDWANKSMKAFGISTLQAKQFTGSMGAMLKSSGLSGDSVVNMSTGLAGLAGDFASFYNLPHDVAWEKIRSGISGETEPLKQLGINMSVANLEAFALTKGITKQWKAMTQAEQVQLRYNYLMEQSKDAQGDFAKTLNTSMANQLRVFQTNLKMTGASIMSKSIPVFTKALGIVNNLFENIDVTTLSENIAFGLNALIDGIQIGFAFIKPNLIAVYNLFKNIGSSIGTMNWEPLVKALKIIASLFKILIDVIQVLWVIAKPVIEGILYLLNPIIDAISWIVDGMGKFSSYLSKIFAGNGEGQKTVEKTIQKTINTGTEKNQEQRQIIAPNQNQAAAVKNSMNVNVNTNVNAPEGYKVDTSVKSRPVSGNMGVNK